MSASTPECGKDAHVVCQMNIVVEYGKNSVSCNQLAKRIKQTRLIWAP